MQIAFKLVRIVFIWCVSKVNFIVRMRRDDDRVRFVYLESVHAFGVEYALPADSALDPRPEQLVDAAKPPQRRSGKTTQPGLSILMACPSTG